MLLTVRSLTLTPSVGPFSITHEPLDTALLPAFDGFCPSGLNDCPSTSSATACTGGICRVDSGDPVDTFVVHVSFTPAAGGAAQATLTIGYDGDQGLLQRDIALAGQGTSGSLLVTPGTVSFTNAFVGRASSQLFTVKNVGTANISVDDISLDSGLAWAVTQAPSTPFVLVPNGEAQLTATINASTPGTFDDVLRVTAGSDDATATLHAEARDAPSAIIPDTLLFGPVALGSFLARDLVIKNGGPGTLQVTGLSVSGPAAARYSITLPTLPSPVAPLANLNDATPNLSVSVTYTPNLVTGATDAATLRVSTDDPDLPFVDVALTGQAIDPQIVVVNNALNFGTVDVGTSSTK